MSDRAIYDFEPTSFPNDDDFADERAQDRKRADFERLAAREYADTGTVLVWQDDTDDDEELDA